MRTKDCCECKGTGSVEDPLSAMASHGQQGVPKDCPRCLGSGFDPRPVGITKFAAGRHFNNPGFAGTRIHGLTPEELVKMATEALEAGAELQPGYAPFCKHLFLANPVHTRAGVARITPDNILYLRSGYQARREGELPVLARWFDGIEAPKAEYLDVILYSHAQLEAEAEGGKPDERDVPDTAWGIVSINAEMQAAESPMQPITMMRNSLGKAEGGSGVPLDREKYAASVEFWSNHATVK